MHCPLCHSAAVRISAKTSACRCSDCGHVWKAAVAPGATPTADLAKAAFPAGSTVVLKTRPRRKPLNRKHIVQAALACLLLISAIWGATRLAVLAAKALQSSSASVEVPPTPDADWNANPALLAELGDERGLGHYCVRLPRGYTQFAVRQQPNWLPDNASFIGVGWVSTPDRKSLIAIHQVKYASAEANGTDLKVGLDRFYARLRRNARATNFLANSPKIGNLGGRQFIKASFSGNIRLDKDLPRVERAGQVLMHLDDKTELTVYFLCNSDASHDSYRQLETSLLTLRFADESLAHPRASPDSPDLESLEE